MQQAAQSDMAHPRETVCNEEGGFAQREMRVKEGRPLDVQALPPFLNLTPQGAETVSDQKARYQPLGSYTLLAPKCCRSIESLIPVRKILNQKNRDKRPVRGKAKHHMRQILRAIQKQWYRLSRGIPSERSRINSRL